jgi:hypothetical protein
MKRKIGYFQTLLAASVLISMQACNEDNLTDLQVESSSNSSTLKSQTSQTFFGPTLRIGNGVARAWIMQDKSGVPSAVGVTLSEKALEKLPDHTVQYVLDIPGYAGSDFYTHALVDWNPEGHEPPGTYDLPHFDVHFYIVPNEDRLSIGPDDVAEFENNPAAMYIPPQYVKIPGGVPQMGAHWVDVLSPEFQGDIFTRTFIWGSYDGEFIFWEPMITMDYLLSQPDEEIPLRLPSAYQREGWYATKYKIAYSSRPGEYTIALTGLTHRSATPVL